MTNKNVFPIILLIVSMLFVGCSNDAPATEAPPPSTADVAPAPTPAPESPAPAAMQSDTVAAAAPALPEKTSETEAKSNKKVGKPSSHFKSNTTAAAQKQNPAGYPTGYIGRENIVFYSEPSTTAQKLSTLKINEAVIILESKMTDEAGKSYDMPQWFKVQLTNKKIGWVVGRSITIN